MRRTGSGKNLALERSSSLSGNDSKAEKMFEEICDEDNPDAAGMEGKRSVSIVSCGERGWGAK